MTSKLSLPLMAKCRRANHEHPADAPTVDEFGEDQASLDRFPKSHIVGDEERDARHRHRLEQRHELVVLRLDRRVEGRTETGRGTVG